MGINELLELVKKYNTEDIEIIKKAYAYAAELHEGQY